MGAFVKKPLLSPPRPRGTQCPHPMPPQDPMPPLPRTPRLSSPAGRYPPNPPAPELTRPSPTSSSPKQGPLNDRNRPAPVLPSHVPTSPANPSPRPLPERIPKERPAGLSFGRFKVGLGGKSKSLPEFFFGIVKGDSFNSERIPLDRQRAQARSPRSLPDWAGSKSRRASPAPPGWSACPASAKKREPPAAALFLQTLFRS